MVIVPAPSCRGESLARSKSMSSKHTPYDRFIRCKRTLYYSIFFEINLFSLPSGERATNTAACERYAVVDHRDTRVRMRSDTAATPCTWWWANGITSNVVGREDVEKKFKKKKTKTKRSSFRTLCVRKCVNYMLLLLLLMLLMLLLSLLLLLLLLSLRRTRSSIRDGPRVPATAVVHASAHRSTPAQPHTVLADRRRLIPPDTEPSKQYSFVFVVVLRR